MSIKDSDHTQFYDKEPEQRTMPVQEQGKPLSNPRYVMYAKVHNKTPEQMMEYDTKKWQGGKMCGFILWINNYSSKFRKAHPEFCIDWHIHNHQEFDKYIENNLAPLAI